VEYPLDVETMTYKNIDEIALLLKDSDEKSVTADQIENVANYPN
jgi:hypothetical protein